MTVNNLRWRAVAGLAALALGVGVLGLTTGTASAAATASTTASSTASTTAAIVGPAQNNFTTAAEFAVLNPNAIPPGSNNFNCKPNATHPFPVVLVHGTFEDQYDNWADLSPQLASMGYCVFSLNYGGPANSALQGVDEIGQSAQQLASFVTKVRQATGASKVDIVGHSQGGMMPRFFIKNLGGAGEVHSLVALVPSNQGTNLDGLVELADLIPGASALVAAECEACVEQETGSTFLTNLNSGGETNPAINYTVIATTHDEVVTPFTNAFLPAASNVTNETLQNFCPNDTTEHIGMSYDKPALQLVFNALDPATARTPSC